MNTPLPTAFRALMAALDQAQRTYHDIDADEGKRQALDAVISFLTNTSYQGYWQTPLHHIRSDLEPVTGKTATLLKSRQVALCVMALDLLLDAKDEAALRKVSNATGGELSEGQLGQLRKDVSARRGRVVAQQMLNRSVSGTADIPLDAKDRAEVVLAAVKEMFCGKPILNDAGRRDWLNDYLHELERTDRTKV